MADNPITLEELENLRRDGAEVSIDPRKMTIDQFADLVSEIRELVKSQNERTRADLARNQTSLEIIASLQALIKQQSGNKMPEMDLSPLKELLQNIWADRQRKEATAYEFTFDFNSQGRYSKIYAEPKPPTRH